MADSAAIDMKLGPEGRVVIPAPIRRHLGISPGDNLRFLLHADGRVEIVSPRMLAMALWANNTGGDAVDSAAMVQDLRREDREVAQRSESAQARGRGPLDLEANTERLLREMDLRR